MAPMVEPNAPSVACVVPRNQDAPIPAHTNTHEHSAAQRCGGLDGRCVRAYVIRLGTGAAFSAICQANV